MTLEEYKNFYENTITVKELKAFLETCPDDAIVETTDRFDTDGLPVAAETMGISLPNKWYDFPKVTIESGWRG